MRSEGHIGFNMILAVPVFFFYSGNIYSTGLWIWFIFFIGMATWPDIDLKFELKHRGYTHTILGALFFGIVSGLIMYSQPKYILYSFLGGFLGTLGHIVGDLLTYLKFRPLWPLSDKKFALGLFRADDRNINMMFLKIGTILFTTTLLFKLLKQY